MYCSKRGEKTITSFVPLSAACKHYENVAKNQRIMLKNRKMPPDRQIPLESWHCEYGENNCIYTIQEYNTYGTTR